MKTWSPSPNQRYPEGMIESECKSKENPTGQANYRPAGSCIIEFLILPKWQQTAQSYTVWMSKKEQGHIE